MTKSNKAPTINDVAALAGTSKRTVSRVINRSEKVNAATRERVQQVIDQLNYSPNLQARGLAANRSYLLGMIYDVPTLFITDIQNGILQACSEAGYELVVHVCPVDSKNPIDDVSRFVRRAKLDGVILLSPVSEIEGLAETLTESDCNFIQFTSELSGESCKQVVTDYLPAISDMTRHLVDFGHREMGYISGTPSAVSSQKRHESFVRALADHGLSLRPEAIVEGAFTYESGARAAKALLALKRRPTAVFAANDEMAFALIHVANDLGLRVPEDLSVVGFDGTPFSTFFVPSLSTIVRRTDEMSSLGMKKLLALINDGPEVASGFKTMISPRFVPGQSTGTVPVSK